MTVTAVSQNVPDMKMKPDFQVVPVRSS